MVRRLVLWDIDRTLQYVGQVDRQVYRDVFAELVGYQPERLPAKGTGRTMPLAVAEMFATNGIDDSQAQALTARALEPIPHRFASYRPRLAQEGVLLPGATAALQAVRALPDTVASVVTGNLRANALVKLETFGLAGYLEAEVGGYAQRRSAPTSVGGDRTAARRRTLPGEVHPRQHGHRR